MTSKQGILRNCPNCLCTYAHVHIYLKFEAFITNILGFIDINVAKREQIWLPNVNIGNVTFELDLVILKVNKCAKNKDASLHSIVILLIGMNTDTDRLT